MMILKAEHNIIYLTFNSNPSQMQIMVRPMQAHLTHDTETFGRMDPYCKIYLGGQYQRSSTCQSGGKDPHWNDRMFFTVPFGTDPMMKVEVMDNDAFEDDVIGYGGYNIAQFLQTRMNTTIMVDLVYKNQHAGRVTIGIEFGGAMGVGMTGVGMGMGMGGMGPMGPMGGPMGGPMMGPGMGGPMGGGMGPMGGMGGGGWGPGW